MEIKMRIVIKQFKTPALGIWRVVFFKKNEEKYSYNRDMYVVEVRVDDEKDWEWVIADAGMGSESSDFTTLNQAKQFVKMIKSIKKISDEDDEVTLVDKIIRKIKRKR